MTKQRKTDQKSVRGRFSNLLKNYKQLVERCKRKRRIGKVISKRNLSGGSRR